jgi:translation initiation factor 2 gamma subunit (eIF-2gamma)
MAGMAAGTVLMDGAITGVIGAVTHAPVAQTMAHLFRMNLHDMGRMTRLIKITGAEAGMMAMGMLAK